MQTRVWLHRLRQLLKWGLRSLVIGLLLGSVTWMLAPWCVEDPYPLLEARTPAKIYVDRHGVPLYAQRGWDYQWRFPVTLAQIHPDVLRAILAAEDANFYHHDGVDYSATLRALWQNVTSGRVVSGASTISMQVATLATGRKRSLWGKFLQASRARKMERLHTKEEILTAYLNHLPFGGKIVGIEAAARYYFGLSAEHLTFAEATFLCGIPQRPNALRPDRHLHATRQRQHLLLKMMVRRQMLTQDEADACYATAPIRLRDMTQPATFQRIAQRDENNHALMAGYAIDATLQRDILHLLRQQLKTLDGVQDGACIVLEKGEVIAYLGTLDFQNPHGGQVDAAAAQRSAGSILKPFIFAEAIEGGLLVPETQLLDAPVRYGDYTPTNYDTGRYHGKISAGEALAKSLNTPVIRLLETLGEARVIDRFKKLQLAPTNTTGLTLALGTGGASLLHLVRAYDTLSTTFSPGTANLIAHMLRRPLPNGTLDIAWKTGTANNNTDAWCVGWTPNFVVGVWFGNKDGSRHSALVGIEAAAPVVNEIFTQLYANRPPPHWETCTTVGDLCQHSGLAPSPSCTTTFRGLLHPDYPLKRCDQCNERATALQILAPIPRTYYGESVTLPLSTNLPNCTWLHNGLPLGTVTEVTLSLGPHTLHAIAPNGTLQSITLLIAPLNETP